MIFWEFEIENYLCTKTTINNSTSTSKINAFILLKDTSICPIIISVELLDSH